MGDGVGDLELGVVLGMGFRYKVIVMVFRGLLKLVGF